ncbi:hypothetical protein HYC85_004457 [Camellia sinensis]|uniref:Uncharacterized protein n=1 Tax=Camellia sinensis TaxID=4442 RepID=A0A7J7HWL4_CAMSI|nr:hypothetical protein HYC85_004457 [Camellia sinensis]
MPYPYRVLTGVPYLVWGCKGAGTPLCEGGGLGALKSEFWTMALDGIVSSPHRRSQNAQNAFSSSSSPSPTKKQYLKEEFGSCSVLLERHRFLLTALALLAFLCTIYLYFAVTLGAGESCSGLTGTQKALCHVGQAKATIAKGKLKFF